jgi:peptidoglycan hydrolase-like protein with peptidoglycan-binding domain
MACGLTPTELQQKLADAGYYQGPIDGEPNPAYLEAIGKFMQDKGLTLESSEEDFCKALDDSAQSKWVAPVVIGGLVLVAIGAVWLSSRKKS